MAKKLNIRLICAVVAASMAITPAAEAGGRGVALGIGLGVLAVGAMAHSAQKAEAQQRARARAQAQAQARAKARAKAQAQAQARARAQAQAKAAAAAKAKSGDVANSDEKGEAAEQTTASTTNTKSTYVAAPSSSTALTRGDVDHANASTEQPVDTAAVVAGTPTATSDDIAAPAAKQTCKKYVPGLGVDVDVDC